MINVFYNSISNLLTSGINNISSAFSNFILEIGAADDAGRYTGGFINFFIKLIYHVVKYILFLVEDIYSYIKKLCGLELEFTSLDTIFSKESDIVFNLLFTGQDFIYPVVKNLIGLAIAVIIIFTIIALIKSQFEAVHNGEDKRVMETLKRTLKAFALLVLTPMIALGGIAFSNLLLQSLYRATNTTGSLSIGSQIFSAASASASTYRNYAQSGMRIPITFDQGNADEIMDYYKGIPATSTYSQYIKSSRNVIYATYMTFANHDFIKFDDINDITGTAIPKEKDVYYAVYDVDTEEPKDAYTKYRRIDAYKEEYFVMADVVDYSVNNGTTFYIKTIQEMLDSITKINDETYKIQTFGKICEQYEIMLYTGISGTSLTGALYNFSDADYPTYDEIYNAYVNGGWRVISYNTKYLSSVGNNEPSTKMEINRVHLRDTDDELKGAKFIMTVEKQVKDLTDNDDGLREYYEPLTVGYVGNGGIDFNSEYILKGQIITARGSFKDAVYPTAIKKDQTDNDDNPKQTVVFYREDIETQTEQGVDNLAKAGINTSKINIFTMFFKKDGLEVNTDINLDGVNLEYHSNPTKLAEIVDGKFKISYFFESFANDENKITLVSMFIPKNFNFVLLIVAPILLIKMFFSAFFGLIQRAYELLLIIMTYPTAIVSYPLDDQGWNTWWQTFMQRLFQTYGLVLGMNFVFMLFPIIEGIEYFNQDEVGGTKIVRRVGGLFFRKMPVSQVTALFNTVTGILFQLAAFTLLQAIPKMVNLIVVGREDELSSNAFADFMAIVSNVGKFAKGAGKVLIGILSVIPNPFSGIINSAKGISKTEAKIKRQRKMANFMRKLVPGSKIIEAAQEKKNMMKKGAARRQAEKALKGELAKATVEPGEKPEKPKEPAADASEEEKKAYQKELEEYPKKLQEWKDKCKEKEDQTKAVEQNLEKLVADQKKENESIRNPRQDTEATKDAEKKDKMLGLDEDSKKKRDKDKDKGNKKSKKGDGEEGEDEDDEEEDNEYAYESDRELKKKKRKAERMKKRLESERKQGWFAGKRDFNADEQAAYDECVKELEAIEQELENRKAYKGKEAREKAQNEYNQLLNTVDMSKPLEKPKAPAEGASEEEKKKYEEDLKKYEEEKANRQRLRELSLVFDRKNQKKKHDNQTKIQEQEEKRREKKQKEIDEQKKKDDILFKTVNKNSKKAIENRLKEIEKRRNKIKEKLKQQGIDVDNYDPTKLTDAQKDLLQEYEAFGDAYVKKMLDEHEKYIKYNAQHEEKVQMENDKKIEGYGQSFFGTVFHPIKSARSAHHTSVASGRMDDTAVQLTKMETELAELAKTKDKSTADRLKYMELLEKYEKLKAQSNVDQNWMESNTKGGRGVNKIVQEETRDREKLERDAVAVLGDDASTQQIDDYVQRIYRQREKDENELFSEGGAGFMGHKAGKRKEIMKGYKDKQKAYSERLAEFYGGDNIEELATMDDKAFEQLGSVYNKQQMEAMKRYREITQRIKKLELLDQARREERENKN